MARIGVISVQSILVTGASGLIGSEVVRHFSSVGMTVHGIDNNLREFFFGSEGSTRWNQMRLIEEVSGYTHHELDIRNFELVEDLVKRIRPDGVVHAAAQPSHDRAAAIPLIDFDVNARGTLHLLEAFRRHAPESPFVYLSTNKVYGDSPNSLPFEELDTRWEFREDFKLGVSESMSIDGSLHSLFGVSKACADLYVQEYGRYFGMPTVSLRGGCLTGPTHSGVELHGFLSYMVKCNILKKPYNVYGYSGKQVRDNIHSRDVAALIHHIFQEPKVAEVYNVGGGYGNSVSLMEAMKAIEWRTGVPMEWDYVEDARTGDHRIYYSDLRKLRNHFPDWRIEHNLESIFDQLVESWSGRLFNQGA